jgi:3-phenylpropionate/cinnamic acid dioxygenase small subunit
VATIADDELRWLADQLEIRNLVARLAQLADTGELADYARCFAADAVWVPPVDAGVAGVGSTQTGIDDIVAGAQSRRDLGIQGPGSNTRHVVSVTSLQRVDASHALGRTYWRYYVQTNAQPELLTMGHYDDQFIRGPGGWLLARRETVRG